LAGFYPLSQHTVAGEVGEKEIHLVGQDLLALEIDVLGMGGREGNGQKLHARLLRCTTGLVVVAALAGGYHVDPGIFTVLAQGFDVVPGKVPVQETATAVQADILIAPEQCPVGKGRGIPAIEFVGVGVGALGGQNGIDRDPGAKPAVGIDPAMELVQDRPEGIGDLAEYQIPGRILVTDPFQRHAGNIGSEYLLIQVVHGLFRGHSRDPISLQVPQGAALYCRNPGKLQVYRLVDPSVRGFSTILGETPGAGDGPMIGIFQLQRMDINMRWILAGLFGFSVGSLGAALPAEVDGKPVPSLAPIIEEVTPSVVNVNTRTRVQVRTSPFMDDPFFRRFFDFPSVPRERVQQSLGSGVVVDAEEGLILTNNHVIDGADDIAVTLEDGRSFSARVIGTDRDTDLAVIQIDADDLKELPLAESDSLRVGDFVVAVGNPFGLGQTVTSGIVSALGRSGIRGLEYQNFIQTDASINPGNSGGALIDLRGRLVGINTAIFTPSGGNVGIGFAIPSSMAARIMEQLVEYGEVRRGNLGVEVQDVSGELAEALGLDSRRGAVITRVQADSAAGEAGLEPGDVIVGINDREVRSAQDLRNTEGLLAVGSQVKLRYLRNGREHTAGLKITEDLDARISGQRLDDRLEGVSLTRIPERARVGGGVLVEEARRNTPAHDSGLRQGDLIVAVNRQAVGSLGEMRELFPVSTDRELALEIRRRGAGYLVVIE